MSDHSEGSIEWEDAAEDLGIDIADLAQLQALEVMEDDEDDGDYTPDEDDMYDDEDDDADYAYPGQYIEFMDAGEDEDEEEDWEDEDNDLILNRRRNNDEEDEDEEDEDEDDEGDDSAGNTYGSGLGVNAPSQTALLQLAALMEAAGGGSRAGVSFLERLLGPSRGGLGMGTRQRTPGERAAERLRERWWQPQVEPHPAGLALLQSGEFGPVGPWAPPVPGARRRPSEVYTVRQRYANLGGGRRHMSSRYAMGAHVHDPPIPNTPGTVVASYPNVPYVGQFCGPNDSIFYSATRGFMLYLYDMAGTRSTRPATGTGGAAPAAADPLATEYTNDVDPDSDDDTDWFGGWHPRRAGRQHRLDDTSLRRIKAEQGEVGQWTVTDAHADRDGRRMIYSSITPYVYMMNTGDDGVPHVELDFTNRDRYEGFGIWSIRFSADGKEVVAGASSGRIMVYDIAAERRSLKVVGHRDDVNAVCFADESSTNVLVSGSDDGYVKVWDRRSLASSTPAGVLPGATEGITYTAPKGDGRYIVVNSKDQAARLYDLRKMRSWSEFEGERDAADRWGFPHFDYRSMRYPPPKRLAHPRDCSVMTYRGHCVLRTLIRCHFSPLESTGQSYIYSGSADGLIHIWSLDGRVVQVLNRADSRGLHPSGVPGAAGRFNDPSSEERSSRARRLGATIHEQGTNYTVRDVAWHAHTPTLMSTCWELEGRYRDATGSIAMHEWKGLGKGGLRSLEDWVEKAAQEAGK